MFVIIKYDMLNSYLRKVHYCAFHLKHGGVRWPHIYFKGLTHPYDVMCIHIYFKGLTHPYDVMCICIYF